MTYLEKFQGRFHGILKWDDFENFWQILKNQSDDWFFYDLNLNPPKSTQKISIPLDEIYKIIKEQHKERYCGIVYSDDLKRHLMIKVFHPKNLGKSCGSSENPPLPRWIISKIKPENLDFLKPKINKSWLDTIFK